MNKNPDFRFTIPPIPEGEALTFAEMEERFLKELKAKDGKCEKSLRNLAQLYSRTERVDEAVRCTERLIELSDDPERHAGYYLALGACMEDIRDYKGAVRFYRQALALEPCRPEVWYWIHNNLGYSLNQLQAYDDAMPYLRRAIEIDPQKPNAYKNLGLASQAIGHLEEAAKLFVRATQVNATDARSLKHLEELMDGHPDLEALVPELPSQLEACRKAVNMANAHQPDFQAIWQRQRQDQEKAKADQEISEALRLIASMRADLALIAGTTDADKLATLILEAVRRMDDRSMQLWQIFGMSFDPETPVILMRNGLAAMIGCAQVAAEHRPDFNKAMLIDEVAKHVPIISSGLDQIAQALREKAEEPK